MLLFSTLLDIQDTLTPESFIRLILTWNAQSTRPENIVQGIDWHGERNVRYGTNALWLEIVDYPEQGIVAVRHEKKAQDGVVWDSDFVMNFREMRMSVQLDRTYSEDALKMDASFSTPHFITLLIENGYLKKDCEIPVLRDPILVTDEDLLLLTKVCNNTREFRLPVVYVTKAEGDTDPVDIKWLASRLKGAAHVLVESDIASCASIRGIIDGNQEPFGAVRVFFPSDTVRRKRYLYRSTTGNSSVRLEKIIGNVIHYWLSQQRDRLYTWQGVCSEKLSQQLVQQIAKYAEVDKARVKAESEIETVFDTFDDELKKLQKKVDELTKSNDALQAENQGLRAKLTSNDSIPLLYFGDEEEFYTGEVRDMILGTLDEALNATEKATRRADVLVDILDSNPYYHLSEERKQKIKAIFRGYKTVTSEMKRELQSLGFDIEEAGKHYKLSYKGDSRYMVTVGKTPSDNRSGSNNAAIISKTML